MALVGGHLHLMVRDGWAASWHDGERAAFRKAPDVGAKVVELAELLNSTWFQSLWRARIDDGDRMDAKRRRTARGIRLLVHLHVRGSGLARRARALYDAALPVATEACSESRAARDACSCTWCRLANAVALFHSKDG